MDISARDYVDDVWCRLVGESHAAGLTLKSLQYGQITEPVSYPDELHRLYCAQLGQRRSFDV